MKYTVDDRSTSLTLETLPIIGTHITVSEFAKLIQGYEDVIYDILQRFKWLYDDMPANWCVEERVVLVEQAGDPSTYQWHLNSLLDLYRIYHHLHVATLYSFAWGPSPTIMEIPQSVRSFQSEEEIARHFGISRSVLDAMLKNLWLNDTDENLQIAQESNLLYIDPSGVRLWHLGSLKDRIAKELAQNSGPKGLRELNGLEGLEQLERVL